jgi:AraC-like DNA-binding protein
VLFRLEFKAPWGVSIADRGTAFYVIAHGCCWLHVKAEPKPVLLSEGDFVVVTRGDAHILRDRPETAAIDFFELVKRHARGKDQVVRAGGEGRLTTFICGGMQFENGDTNPLVGILPPLLHVRAAEQDAHPWIGLTVKHVLAELDSGDIGMAEVVTRLVDILFIQAVRSYFEENADTAEFGWLAAVRDQRIGPALALLHAQLDKPWTIDSLAHLVAMSRSTFANAFTKLVGEPPIRYLTRIRIHAAATRMRSSDDGLKAVAAATGYESVAAFTRAFRRQMGITPGEYRDASRAGTSLKTRP